MKPHSKLLVWSISAFVKYHQRSYRQSIVHSRKHCIFSYFCHLLIFISNKVKRSRSIRMRSSNQAIKLELPHMSLHSCFWYAKAFGNFFKWRCVSIFCKISDKKQINFFSVLLSFEILSFGVIFTYHSYLISFNLWVQIALICQGSCMNQSKPRGRAHI